MAKMLKSRAVLGLCAALALVAGCVERYPDKEYLSTYLPGGSGGGGGGGGGQDATTGGGTDAVSAADVQPDVQLTPLETCLYSYCNYEVNTCYYNQVCWKALQCAANCGPTPDCKNACVQVNSPVLFDLLACAAQSCAAYL